MELDPGLDSRDDRVQRAELRDRILGCARRIGWPAHSAIVFTEQQARRPWKRCTASELATVLDELQLILAARSATTGPSPLESGASRSGREHHHAAPA